MLSILFVNSSLEFFVDKYSKKDFISSVLAFFSIVCSLSDICVKPEYQGQGIGLQIVNRLREMIEADVKEGEKMQIELTPTAGKEAFYQKAGFKYKPDVITGMYLWIQK